MFYFIMHCYSFVTFFISNNSFHDNNMSFCTFFHSYLFHNVTFYFVTFVLLLFLSISRWHHLSHSCGCDFAGMPWGQIWYKKLSWTWEWTDLNWLVILNLRNTFLAITPDFTPMCIGIKWQHVLLYYIT